MIHIGPRIAAATLAACALASSTACAVAGSFALPTPTARASNTGGAKGPSTSNPAASLVRRLSTARLAGQRIVYAYSGASPPKSLLSRIRLGQAAGVIFFSDNIRSPTQLAGVIRQLQAANRSSPIHAPLLMLVDQEGGRVRRLPGPPVLSEKEIGRTRHASAVASETGADTGRSLRLAGINVNLAPVVDVFRAPGDFIDQYQRAYSSQPSRVGALAAAFIVAQQRAGVAATAKHFPGLGPAAATQNTDARPVTLATSIDQLREADEAPYRNVVAAGVKLVMTSWAVYPALDAHRPAGLSRAVIRGELRGRLGFRGVTITDSIGAGALRTVGGIRRRALLAAQAGADLILCSGNAPTSSNTPAAGVTALHALVDALDRHTLDRAGTEQAVERIIELREGLAR